LYNYTVLDHIQAVGMSDAIWMIPNKSATVTFQLERKAHAPSKFKYRLTAAEN